MKKAILSVYSDYKIKAISSDRKIVYNFENATCDPWSWLHEKKIDLEGGSGA